MTQSRHAPPPRPKNSSIRFIVMSDDIMDRISDIVGIPSGMVSGISQLDVKLRRGAPAEFTMSAELLQDTPRNSEV